MYNGNHKQHGVNDMKTPTFKKEYNTEIKPAQRQALRQAAWHVCNHIVNGEQSDCKLTVTAANDSQVCAEVFSVSHGIDFLRLRVFIGSKGKLTQSFSS